MAEYNKQLNGPPDPNSYVGFNPTPVGTYTDKAPGSKQTVDYTGYTQLPPILKPTKDVPKVEASTKEGTPTAATAVKPIDPVSYNPAPFKQYTPSNNTLNFSDFESRIRHHESGDNAGATNKNSSASGYYQFIWKDWHDSIKNVTGITDRDTFLKSPDAQKSFFKYYYDNHIVPNVQKIKSALGGKNPLNDFDLAQLIHFRGAHSAEKLIENGELNTKKEAYNPTALDYITGK